MSGAATELAALDHAALADLFRTYQAELRTLARQLRPLYHRLQGEDFGTTFGDVEGEVLYLLARHARPDMVFEISPNAGWSTNYLLAALTANQHGRLHSFELEPLMGGRPTEQVIRANQHPAWDQSRLTVHIGDARHTTPRVPGAIDLLLLDSCHDDWFAEWYIATLFPRVRGPVMVQDIAFADQLEPSSEARRVWDWLTEQRVAATLIGQVERSLDASGARAGLAERRGLRSNAVVFTLPLHTASPTAGPPTLEEGPAARLAWVEANLRGKPREEVDAALTDVALQVLRDPSRVNRHRDLLRVGRAFRALGESAEAGRCFQRALACALQADRRQRVKALREMAAALRSLGERRLALQAAALLALEIGGPRALADSALPLATRGVRGLRRRLGAGRGQT